MTLDLFTRLYFRNYSFFVLQYLHEKYWRGLGFSRVNGLANLRENKVLANKKCFTVDLANLDLVARYLHVQFTSL